MSSQKIAKLAGRIVLIFQKSIMDEAARSQLRELNNHLINTTTNSEESFLASDLAQAIFRLAGWLTGCATALSPSTTSESLGLTKLERTRNLQAFVIYILMYNLMVKI